MDPPSSIAQRTRARKFRTSNVKETNMKKLNSNEVTSPTQGRAKENRKEIKTNIGPSNRYEDDRDIVKIFSEIVGGDKINPDKAVSIEGKNSEIIFIEDSTSDEGEGEKNCSKSSRVDGNKNTKVFVHKGSSSYSPKENNGNGLDGKDKDKDKEEEDGDESMEEEEDDSSDDEDFDMDISSSSTNNDSSDEDFYVPERRNGKKVEEKEGSSGVEKSDSQYKNKGKGLAMDEPKKRKIFTRRRQRQGISIIEEESRDDEVVGVTEAIHQAGGVQNAGPSNNNGVDEIERMEGEIGEKRGDLLNSVVNENQNMEEEISKEGGDLPKSNETERMEQEINDNDTERIEEEISENETERIEEEISDNETERIEEEISDDKTERIEEDTSNEEGNLLESRVNEADSMEQDIGENDGDLLKSGVNETENMEQEISENEVRRGERELADRKRKKNVGCSTFCKECGHAVAHKTNSDNVDAPASRDKATVDKDETNESSSAKKATARKTVPNVAVQVERSLRRSRRYQASGDKNEPNAGATLEESANEERDNTPLNDLGAKQTEENVCSQEEGGSAWFTKTKPVPQKKRNFFKVLAEAILREDNVPNEERSQEQAEPSSAAVAGSSPPMKFSFEDEKPVKSTDMFTELECYFEYESMDAFDSNQAGNITEIAYSSGNSCGEGKHDVVRNEQDGDVCRICHCIVNETRHLLPDFAKFASRSSGKRSEEKEDFLVPEGLDASTIMENHKDFYNSTDNTVWSLVPGLRESLYKHQQDGFEFLWKNLTGATDLDELKSTEPKDVGGCIISHAPGTGKTRLSIVFVQSYLRMFPDAKPVVIAPASMLLTWEEEFRKWNVEFPFHNICNPELSGRESKDLLKLFTMSRNQDTNKVRWVKIFSWKKGNSILGISYNLYEKLAGEKVSANDDSENLKKILLDLPKLVVLDEGHIPRNQTSSIWKTLLKLQTEKRVILSGTPFQNNFDELFNTLHLVRPGIIEKEKAFAGMVSTRRRYSKRPRSSNENSVLDARTREVNTAIEKIKEIMEPFVHVHKGSILRKNLPGLTDCVVLLNPQPLQKSLIEKMEYSENSFELQYKVALLSVHPTLVEHCWTSAHEKSGFHLDKIKELRLDPAVGVKTRFIMNLIQSSRAMNEKVLIFSQYIHPLKLIMDQLESSFGWHDGKEVLHMQGRQDQLQRQKIIGIFNNPDSEAKVLLAATKCCSEGINLVGASRVVLLDVVWNPSVERQAISRAYRLGQKKVVYTYHLITSGTNEGDKYCRQVEKDRLSELVFCSAPNDNDEPRVQTTNFEDRILEKMINDGNMKDMISKIIHKPKEANLNETFGSVGPA